LWPFVVEPGPNVTKDFASGIVTLEVFDLAVKIFLLMSAGDSGIADLLSVSVFDRGDSDAFLFFVELKDGIEGFSLIEALTSMECEE
jgi:hypothetical protein